LRPSEALGQRTVRGPKVMIWPPSTRNDQK